VSLPPMRCPPDPPRCGRSLATLGAFANGTMLYTMSQMWHDLLWMYLFPILPQPYCELQPDLLQSGACERASASVQWKHALWLLLVVTFVDWGTVVLEHRVPALVTLRPMASMTVGCKWLPPRAPRSGRLRVGVERWCCACSPQGRSVSPRGSPSATKRRPSTAITASR
jgi:hypothetical protein